MTASKRSPMSVGRRKLFDSERGERFREGLAEHQFVPDGVVEALDWKELRCLRCGITVKGLWTGSRVAAVPCEERWEAGA